MLKLENGQEITADLYVDCTGFKSLLLGEYLQEPFIDYTDLLPNNKAWATQIEYKDKEKELNSVTTCTAIENGWCWDIPLWSRLGSGYVYSDKYVSDEEALNQFKKYLQSSKMTIPRSLEEVNEFKYKNIKMRVGIHERTWVGNVVAIGLSAGFIEPLESNGLFTVHEFLFQLVSALDRGFISQWSRDVYNETNKETFDGFVDFIRMHYLLTSRDDTPYWKDNLNRPTNFKNDNRTNLSNRLEQVRVTKTRTFGPPTIGGTTWISTGMNYPLMDKVAIRLGEIKNLMDYKAELNNDFNNLKQKQTYWENESLSSLSLHDYLKNKYYE
jgi:tryptophan halogenase